MDKREFLLKVRATHQEYDSVLAYLSEFQLLQSQTCGDWSVKDVIAHITWYERQMVEVIKTHVFTGSNLWIVSLEERNAAIQQENKDRSLAELIDESKRVFTTLDSLLESLSEEDMLDANRFRGMPADWIPWEVIASNTFEHYPVHTEDIRAAFP